MTRTNTGLPLRTIWYVQLMRVSTEQPQVRNKTARDSGSTWRPPDWRHTCPSQAYVTIPGATAKTPRRFNDLIVLFPSCDCLDLVRAVRRYRLKCLGQGLAVEKRQEHPPLPIGHSAAQQEGRSVRDG